MCIAYHIRRQSLCYNCAIIWNIFQLVGEKLVPLFVQVTLNLFIQYCFSKKKMFVVVWLIMNLNKDEINLFNVINAIIKQLLIMRSLLTIHVPETSTLGCVYPIKLLPKLIYMRIGLLCMDIIHPAIHLRVYVDLWVLMKLSQTYLWTDLWCGHGMRYTLKEVLAK